jgi:hypothetical protein
LAPEENTLTLTYTVTDVEEVAYLMGVDVITSDNVESIKVTVITEGSEEPFIDEVRIRLVDVFARRGS